ncbi:hypothetical protein [Nocardia cyriacigeorgica]|uniref:hypothetical protein n=1 Tax=Nocardia cyriacigeorgica TaxID=135487 RepID=UPI003CC8086D
MVAAREESGPYTSLLDLTGRGELTVRQAESRAAAGAGDSLPPPPPPGPQFCSSTIRSLGYADGCPAPSERTCSNV